MSARGLWWLVRDPQPNLACYPQPGAPGRCSSPNLRANGDKSHSVRQQDVVFSVGGCSARVLLADKGAEKPGAEEWARSLDDGVENPTRHDRQSSEVRTA